MVEQDAKVVIWQKWPLMLTDSDTIAENYVGAVILNRPDKANAFDDTVMDALRECFAQAAGDPCCRLLVLMGAGNHFSAGADLAWMRRSADMTAEENREQAKKLQMMCETLYRLPMPTVAFVHGAVYGGGLGLVASCDIAFAHEESRFCLSEVKMGLIPAVILPYLARKMKIGLMNHHILSGKAFDATAAERSGLIQKILSRGLWQGQFKSEIDALLGTAPTAQRAFKALRNKMMDQPQFTQADDTVQAIASLRVAPEAQLALTAFLEKKDSPWRERLTPSQGFATTVN